MWLVRKTQVEMNFLAVLVGRSVASPWQQLCDFLYAISGHNSKSYSSIFFFKTMKPKYLICLLWQPYIHFYPICVGHTCQSSGKTLRHLDRKALLLLVLSVQTTSLKFIFIWKIHFFMCSRTWRCQIRAKTFCMPWSFGEKIPVLSFSFPCTVCSCNEVRWLLTSEFGKNVLNSHEELCGNHSWEY